MGTAGLLCSVDSTMEKIVARLDLPEYSFLDLETVKPGILHELQSTPRVRSGMCDRCHGDLENTEHLFFDCIKVRNRWQELRYLLHHTGTLQHLKGTLFESIKAALQLHKRNPGPIVLLTEICKVNWHERNA